jgi:hypothetical protein
MDVCNLFNRNLAANFDGNGVKGVNLASKVCFLGFEAPLFVGIFSSLIFFNIL